MLEIRFATLDDTEALMHFMHEHWRAGHILSTNRALFLHDFQDGERLNLAIAVDPVAGIVGLFGFMPYSGGDAPDLAGSLWKALLLDDEPMLGNRLREFVIEQIPHRLFAAPGAGLQTRPIYHFLHMDWIEMDQYFRLNPELENYALARVPGDMPAPPPIREPGGVRVRPVANVDELRDFPFDRFERIVPRKDLAYVGRRYFEHPLHRYHVLLAEGETQGPVIAVYRIAEHQGHSACRIVDLIGDEHCLPAVVAALDTQMRAQEYEYVDFINCGFSAEVLADAGMRPLDFDQEELIIPNYFGPFEQRNVRVYAVADRSDELRVRLCKADGDQDRPSQ